MHELFEAEAARRPEAVALSCDGVTVSYGQLNGRANRLARQLVQFGVKADTLVGICLERTNELVIALLAILKAGGAYLPIDLAYPAERLAFMLEDAEVPLLITQRSLASKLPETKAKVLCVEDLLAGPPQGNEEENLQSSANAGSPRLRNLYFGHDWQTQRLDDHASQRDPTVRRDKRMVRVR